MKMSWTTTCTSMRTKLILVLSFVLLFVAARAQEVPLLYARVNDYANLLSDEVELVLNTQLAQHEEATSNQVVVLTINSLEGAVLEDYANTVFNTWALGQADKDNGVLLLISKNDRKMRIEVGYGLEGRLTDSEAGRIIRNTIAPHFKKGEFEAGITAGTLRILEACSSDGSPEATSEYSEFDRFDGEDWASYILFWLLIGGAILLVLYFAFRRWIPRRSKSGLWMKRLSEAEEDKHLSKRQQFEERIGSVNYDVWVAPDGSEVKVESFAVYGKYISCNKCSYKAAAVYEQRVLRRATYGNTGARLVRRQCTNCGHKTEDRVVIPRKVRYRSTAGGYSGGGGGGGFSGGGGSSGGGGASGGW